MKRIAILGKGGAGKSTLARKLGEILGLPIYHLDAYFWKPGWVQTEADEWQRVLEELVSGEAWITDGNFGRFLDVRLRAADTVIFLDLPRHVCLWRVIKRWVKYSGKSRPDMAPGCPEQIDFEFIKWIWTYNHGSRVHLMQCVESFGGHCEFIILRSPRQVRSFLQQAASERS